MQNVVVNAMDMLLAQKAHQNIYKLEEENLNADKQVSFCVIYK